MGAATSAAKMMEIAEMERVSVILSPESAPKQIPVLPMGIAMKVECVLVKHVWIHAPNQDVLLAWTVTSYPDCARNPTDAKTTSNASVDESARILSARRLVSPTMTARVPAHAKLTDTVQRLNSASSARIVSVAKYAERGPAQTRAQRPGAPVHRCVMRKPARVRNPMSARRMPIVSTAAIVRMKSAETIVEPTLPW